jgi:hypothetical protein
MRRSRSELGFLLGKKKRITASLKGGVTRVHQNYFAYSRACYWGLDNFLGIRTHYSLSL